jgi:hypothetical protein
MIEGGEMILAIVVKSELLMKAMREAQSYKWAVQSVKHEDLGDQPILDWFQRKWAAWYRDRWVEHLCGRRKWSEFGDDDFNLVANRQFQPNLELVLRIIDNLKKHRDSVSENLGMILGAAQRGDKDLEELMVVLRRLDINGKRPSYDEFRVKNFFHAIEEADRHKYIESQKAGCDLGEGIVVEWFDKHWPEFAKTNGLSEDSI